MLFNSIVFERIVEEELDEDGWADSSDWRGGVEHHHFLYLLDEVIQVSTHEPTMNDWSQAWQRIALDCELWNVASDYLHQGLDLDIRQILIDGVCLYQFASAFEQRVDKVRIWCLGLLEQLEDAVQEFSEQLLEARQAQTDNLCHDMQSTYNDWVMICFEGVKNQQNKWIKPGHHLLKSLFSFLIMLTFCCVVD